MTVDMRPVYLRAVWSTAMVNDLPDSSFLLVIPGGTKTAGKTDGAHRFFPVKDADGKVDIAHLNNALARIPQASSLTPAQRAAAMAKAKALAAAHPDIGSGPTKEYQGSAGSGRSRVPMPAEVMGLQTRTFEVALELRSDGDGRTVLGRAVPYGETIDIPGGSERFVLGAFNRQIAGGQVHTVKLHTSHTGRMAGDLAVGKTVTLTERSDGLHGAWELYDTPRGNEALHLIKTGEVTGLSIGFKALDGGTTKGADGAYERHAAHLDHVAVTTEPAYTGAVVTAVRDSGGVHPAAAYRRDLYEAKAILDRVLTGG